MSELTFDELVRRATAGHEPFDYQREIAIHGLPELLEAPTGSGKTLAAVLPWLYRRRYAGPEAAEATPSWLVFVLPMRVLVEQTRDVVRTWLERLGLSAEIEVHTLLGGETLERSWRFRVGRDTVIIGTLDMVLSRAINRGYGESRYVWPLDFGLLNFDSHFVFDEVQLMGPALLTSRQLDAFRRSFGTYGRCASTWMSATVRKDDLLTVDAPDVRSVRRLSAADRDGPLASRLTARKTVRRLGEGSNPGMVEVTSRIVAAHRPGTLTLVVVNTVARARALARAITKSNPPTEDVVLLHSRFRPPERRRQVSAALAPVDESGPGRIVVSTQVVEAGVDVSARVLVTDVAPWPSVVQRLGRCNRYGEQASAEVWWIPASGPPEPYAASDLEATMAALSRLEGSSASPASLERLDAPVVDAFHPSIRRKDLLDLFDTTPDLSGNDIDVSPYIRPVDDSDVAIAWRVLGEGAPPPGTPAPGRDERCPVPAADVRKLARELPLWVYDVRDARYERLRPTEVRPGLVLLADVSVGRYTAAAGWDPKSRAAAPASDPPAEDPIAKDLAVGDDPLSEGPRWLGLREHLADAEAEAQAAVAALGWALPEPIASAVVRAAALHDVGKAHEVFQRTMRNAVGAAAPPAADVVLAKSGGAGRLRHERPGFRHELVSALCLLGEGEVALADVEERDLVRYLVAAHHGRVRVGVRALPREHRCGAGTAVLGVCPGDQVPPAPWPHGQLPPMTMSLEVAALGTSGAGPSWTARALDLRDRDDLGPFRLAFLEALVRIADWRASATPGAGGRDG